MSVPTHIPVLLTETIEGLCVQPGGRYVDCTLGGGGHAAAILEQSSPGGQLLGIDADAQAIEIARERLEDYRDSTLLVNENFTNLSVICTKYGFFPVHGILFDLGLSSLQLNGNGRGFSFRHDAPLDMRLSPNQKVTAADIINTYSEAELAHLIRAYGEEWHSRRIARYIVRERPINSSLHLARVIKKVVRSPESRIHPATKTFQALRIVVNQELENLETALQLAVNILGFKGRLAVITYHSLEDRIVKRFMQREAKRCICPPSTPICTCEHQPSLKLITRKVIAPSPAEVQRNPRSRSAKLRVAERIIAPAEPSGFVENLHFSARLEAQGWRRPALVDRLRKTFLTLQVQSF